MSIRMSAKCRLFGNNGHRTSRPYDYIRKLIVSVGEKPRHTSEMNDRFADMFSTMVIFARSRKTNEP